MPISSGAPRNVNSSCPELVPQASHSISSKTVKSPSKSRKGIAITNLFVIFGMILMGAMIYFSLNFHVGSHLGPHSLPVN